MELNCKQCGAEIPAENVNLDRLMAKCAVCNAVFSFAGQFGESDESRDFNRLEVPLPKGFTVDNFGSDLTITHRWFSPKYIFMTVFALLWNGFMVVWFGMSIWAGAWPMVFCGLLHAGVGLWLIYHVLAGYVNKTVIRVNMQDVEIKHGPIPYPGHKRLDRADIEQLYCQEHISRGRNSTTYTYQVHAITRAEKHEKLLAGLDDSEQALYLEQEIERALGIRDRPVRGEWGR